MLPRQSIFATVAIINMLAPIQSLLFVRLLAIAWRVTGAFQLSQRVRTHLCRVFVIAPRTLASALRLVQPYFYPCFVLSGLSPDCARSCFLFSSARARAFCLLFIESTAPFGTAISTPVCLLFVWRRCSQYGTNFPCLFPIFH